MIILLPIIFSFLMFLLKDNDLITKYSIIMIFIYFINITIGKNIIFIFLMIILYYWLLNENNNFYSLFFVITSIFIFYANSLYAFFISIELISFIMITYINLYIQDKYPGILYYLFSGIFTAIFIFSLGYIYMGYTISYSLIVLVFIWKLGLGPLHILIPNIYNSLSPKKILFIDIICKYLLFYTFYRLLLSININLNIVILFTILTGTLLSLNESNLLNILVYSSISNYGLILILIKNLNLYIIYLMFYSCATIIYLYLIVNIWIKYSIDNKYYIILWSILIFNLIGIPPLTGFWVKLYAIQLLIINTSYAILFIILISLILISSVYLRILLGFIMNDNLYKFTNINNTHSHFISSLIVLLSYPCF